MIQIPIFDGHNDTLLHTDVDSFLNGGKGQLDYPRIIQGGLIGGIFSINVPASSSKDEPENNFTKTSDGYKVSLAPKIDHIYAKDFTDKYLGLLSSVITGSNNKIALVKNSSDLDSHLKNNVFSILLHFEGAEMIDDNLNLLTYY